MAVQEPRQPDLTDESSKSTSLVHDADDTDTILPGIGTSSCKSEGTGPKLRRPSHCTMQRPGNSGEKSTDISSPGTDNKMTLETLHETESTGGHCCVASAETNQGLASLATCLVDDELMSSTAEVPLSFTSFSANASLEGDELESSTGFVPLSQSASLAGMSRLLACSQKLQSVPDDKDLTFDDRSTPQLDSSSTDLERMCSLTTSVAEPVTRQQASSIVRPKPISDAEIEAALSINTLKLDNAHMKRSSIPQSPSSASVSAPRGQSSSLTTDHLRRSSPSRPSAARVSTHRGQPSSLTSDRRQSPSSRLSESIQSKKSSMSHRAVSPRRSPAPARKQILTSPRSVTPLRAVTPPRNLASGSYTSLSPFPAATFGKASREDIGPQRSNTGRSPSPDAYRTRPWSPLAEGKFAPGGAIGKSLRVPTEAWRSSSVHRKKP